jgi:Glycoside hydrolase 97
MVDFHGAYKPTGLARTYSNYITQEGVLGNEYNKLQDNQCTLLHTITLPFTRALLGPMDFNGVVIPNHAPQMIALRRGTQAWLMRQLISLCLNFDAAEAGNNMPPRSR